MLLTVTTTHEPATDLGYLLVKHPDRMHAFELPTGTAYVCYPQATRTVCTAALILDIDPLRLGGTGHRHDAAGFTLGRFVNDRPYAASSLLAAALNKVFRSAVRGDSRDRPELAATPIPLELRIPVLRCRGGSALAQRLFAPLGWQVTATPLPLDEQYPAWGDSRYVDLTLRGTLRLREALNHAYVLLPVLDDAKHYWVAPDEVDKLLRAGDGWLAGHPDRDLIGRRYLAQRRALTAEAGRRLAEIDRLTALAQADDDAVDEVTVDDATVDDDGASCEEGPEPSRAPLARQRIDAVLAAVAEAHPSRVLDLGCGSGALLVELLKDRRYVEVVGVDVSTQALALAERRLHLDRRPQRDQDRLRLWQSALTYLDDRLIGFDVAVLMEVIEHIDPARLPAASAAVFGHARPSTVVVTTPNVEYNTHYGTLAPGAWRHHDHRFEWTRAEFTAWATGVGAEYGYRVEFRGVGEPDDDTATPTQMAIFTRAGITRAGDSA